MTETKTEERKETFEQWLAELDENPTGKFLAEEIRIRIAKHEKEQDEKIVEGLARYISKHPTSESWNLLTELDKEYWRNEARQAIQFAKAENIISNWGKDHWSTFAYVESLAVDNKGIAIPEAVRMRTNLKTNAGTGGGVLPCGTNMDAGEKYPTRMKHGELKGHDDWDCLEDCVKEGLLESVGTGTRPAYKLTEKGKTVAEQLRRHKMEGKQFKDFTPEE